MKKPCNCGQHHCTLEEFNKLSPYEQGYITYMQAEHPGSELKKHQKNPYPISTMPYELFKQGQQQAVLNAQDSED